MAEEKTPTLAEVKQAPLTYSNAQRADAAIVASVAKDGKLSMDALVTNLTKLANWTTDAQIKSGEVDIGERENRVINAILANNMEARGRLGVTEKGFLEADPTHGLVCTIPEAAKNVDFNDIRNKLGANHVSCEIEPAEVSPRMAAQIAAAAQVFGGYAEHSTQEQFQHAATKATGVALARDKNFTLDNNSSPLGDAYAKVEGVTPSEGFSKLTAFENEVQEVVHGVPNQQRQLAEAKNR